MRASPRFHLDGSYPPTMGIFTNLIMVSSLMQHSICRYLLM
nr:MAG TPA: hypothetical protein [Bacteriophage sp.]